MQAIARAAARESAKRAAAAAAMAAAQVAQIKRDIKEVRDIVKEKGLSRDQQRKLHDRMTKEKIHEGGLDKLPRDRIKEMADEVLRKCPND